nr:MAG TPA: hypothetical protein [Caudoviricetes sp.]
MITSNYLHHLFTVLKYRNRFCMFGIVHKNA